MLRNILKCTDSLPEQRRIQSPKSVVLSWRNPNTEHLTQCLVHGLYTCCWLPYYRHHQFLNIIPEETHTHQYLVYLFWPFSWVFKLALTQSVLAREDQLHQACLQSTRGVILLLHLQSALPFLGAVIFYFHFVAALINPGKCSGRPLIERTFAFKDKAVSLSSLLRTAQENSLRKEPLWENSGKLSIVNLGLSLKRKHFKRKEKQRQRRQQSDKFCTHYQDPACQLLSQYTGGQSTTH